MKKNILILLLLGFILGCAVKKDTLCIFFDGVYPPPEQEQEVQIQEGDVVIDDESVIKFVQHVPYEKGLCKYCHDFSKPKFLKQRVPKLCFACHEKFEGEKIHGPVKMGMCVTCHNPHQSQEKKLLKVSLMNTCAKCHKKQGGDKFKHFPGEKGLEVSELGSCAVCHNPHAGEKKLLKITNERDLCLKCHEPNEKQSKKIQRMFGFPKCSLCHDVHDVHKDKLEGAKQHMPFKSWSCTICHKKGSVKLQASSVGMACGMCHNIVEDKDRAHMPAKAGMCVTCHNPHYSFEDKLMKMPVNKACSKCHKGVAKKFSHFPKEKGNCASCHNPHEGDKKIKYLKATDKELCTTCHKFNPEKENDNIDLEMMYNMPTCMACHKKDVHGKK